MKSQPSESLLNLNGFTECCKGFRSSFSVKESKFLVRFKRWAREFFPVNRPHKGQSA